MRIPALERRVAISNICASIFASLGNFLLLEWLFEKKKWAFLGQGNLGLAFIFFILIATLLSNRYYTSVFVFLAGLEHYTNVVKRIFLMSSLLGLSIFFFGFPAGRNYLVVTFTFLTCFWLLYRKLISALIRSQLKNLKVLLVSDKVFISKFFESYFGSMTTINSHEFSVEDCKNYDFILFNDLEDFDEKHILRVARLESLGATVGYITNEMRLQGWSGLQIPIGPHLILINMGYRSAFFMKGFKRIFDLVFTIPFLFALTLLLPFFRIIYVSANGSPFLYKQKRIGASGREFKVFKIRTMRTGSRGNDQQSEELRWLQKPKREELVTGGEFLRRWSLDEIPQLLNVAKGDMSLVGPRPRLSNEVDENYKLVSPLYTHKIKPGLTGIWQISGRNEISPSFALILDKYYMDHWSPIVDLQIILRTISSIVLGVGAK